jgi:hypothetical protein
MSDTVLGIVVLAAMVAVGAIACLVYSRRFNRMSVDEQEELRKKAWRAGKGGGTGGCGGCGA